MKNCYAYYLFTTMVSTVIKCYTVLYYMYSLHLIFFYLILIHVHTYMCGHMCVHVVHVWYTVAANAAQRTLFFTIFNFCVNQREYITYMKLHMYHIRWYHIICIYKLIYIYRLPNSTTHTLYINLI